MKNKGKLYITSLAGLCATFLCCAVFAFTGLFGIYSGGNVQTAQAVDAEVTTNGFTWDSSAPYATIQKGGSLTTTLAAWNSAVSYSISTGKVVKFILTEDWTATPVTIDDVATTQFGDPSTNVGVDKWGGLLVPSGAKIQLDLNGHTINRNLYTPSANGAATANLPLATTKLQPVTHGSVITVISGSASDTTSSTDRDNAAKRPQLEIIDSTATAGYDISEKGIYKKGTTTLPGMIRGGCASDSSVGGGIFIWGGEFRLTSGVIAYNYGATRGGAINGQNKVNLYITGGAIVFNHCGNMGGGIYITSNTFIPEITGGTLAYNYTAKVGGGIYLAASGKTVLNLDATSGTGVQIVNNLADNNGGGIYCNTLSGVQLGLCRIAYNMAKNYGGGIYLVSGCYTPEVHGNPYVLENKTTAGVASNLYFSGSEQIKVTAKLTKNTSPQIGVFMAALGTFTQNFVSVMGSAEMASDYFESDNSLYTVNIQKGVEGSLILLNSYQAVWNSAVNLSMKNGTQVEFSMDPNTSITGNWNAESGSFGTGVGFEAGGALLVPAGANIKLNLKTRAINRGLTAGIANGYVIKVLGTLTITGESTIDDTNGTITGGMITGGYSSDATAGGVHVAAGGTLNIQSGAIYNNKHTYTSGAGIGVYVTGAGATATMSGGYVTKNVTTGTGSHDGGGVMVYTNAVFNFTAGEISWNECKQGTSSHGAGVLIGNTGTFNMSGGTIKNNTTTACGGGVFMEGTMNLSGGTITDNVAAVGNRGSGAGIFVATTHILNISGNAKVYGNKGGTGLSNNIEFEVSTSTATYTTLFTVKGALTGSLLGVNITDRTVYSTGLKSPGGITDPSTIFFSDNPAYKATVNSSGELIFSQLTTYNEIWQTAVNVSKNNGNVPVIFTLATLNKSWEASNGSFGTATGCYENGALLVPSGATIIIELAGYKIDRKLTAATANGYVLAVRGTCTIQDSDGTTVNTSGELVPKSGKPGGAITGGYNSTVSVPAGVLVAASATLNLKSGCIWGNQSSSAGNRGGVGMYVLANGTFNMSGGYVSKNVSVGSTGSLDGGGVDMSGTMNMSGGEISYNQLSQSTTSSGAGVCVNAAGTFNYTAGTIKNNTTTGVGGGILITSDNANFSGTLNITGNTSRFDDDIVLYSTHVINIKSKVTAATPIKVAFNTDSAAYREITKGAGAAGMTITDIRNVFTAAVADHIVGGWNSGTALEGYMGYSVTALEADNKTYNTSAQTLVKNFDATKVDAALSYAGGTTAQVTDVTGTNAGTYVFTFHLYEGYVWNDAALNYSASSTAVKTITVTIAKAQVNSITWGDVSKTYDGTALNASITNFATATALTAKPTVANMFTVAGTITNKGTQKATATLKDTANYEFAATVANSVRDSASVASTTLFINARSVADDTTVTVSGTYTYTGSALTPTYTVNNSVVNKNLVKDTDFTVSYSNATNAGTTAADDLTSAGTVTITITGTGNYSGSTTQTFIIAPRTLTTDTTVTVNGTYTYTGNALTPVYTVNNSVTGANLTKDTDFTASYSNATNAGTTAAGDLTSAGTVTVTVEGKGNYTGTATQTFTIGKASITAYTWDNTSFDYDGQAKQPKIATVTTAARDGLPADVADMFNYSGGATAGGGHTATAVLKDDYAANYEISGASDKKTVTTAFNIALAAITVTATAYVGTYDGKKHKILTAMPTATGEDLDGNNIKWYFSATALDASDSGWTEFTAQTDLPDVMNVADTHTYYFKVTADNHEPYVFIRVATVNAKSLNAEGTTDFADGISASAISDTAYVYNGAEHSPTVTVTDTNAAITSNDYGFTYSNNKYATKSAVLIVNGKGNYAGTVQILFTINQRDIGSGDISVNGVADKTFNNSAQKISPEVNDGGANIPTAILTATTDYTVTYTRDGADTADFTSAGIIIITIKGAGNYTGSISVSYEIKPYDLSASGAVNIADIANKTYTASEITPEPSVTVTFANGTVTLVKGTDFDYSYADNKNAGTATVTVTGKGNYTLSADATFEIEKVVISSISGITADSKTYDGTVNATLHTDGATIAGNLDGNNLVILTAVGEFNSKDAATGKTVTVTVTALGGSAEGNYELKDGKIVLTATPSSGSSIDINRLVIEIEWEWTEYRYYDGQPHIPGATVKNICGEDVVTLATSYEGEGSPTQPNRDYIAVVTGMLGADMNNYDLPATVRTTYRILTTNAPAYVDADTLTAVYDGTAKQPVMMAMGEDGNYSVLTNTDSITHYTFTFKDLSGATLEGAPSAAGVYTLSIELSANYSWSDGDTKNPREYTFTITPATVTKVAFEALSGTLVYDKNTVHSLVIDWAAFEVDGVVIGSQPQGITVTYLYDGAASAGVSGAGTHTVKAVFTVDGNYNAIAYIEQQFVIEKAEIDLGGISFADRGEAYTGDTYSLLISGTLPAEISVTYAYTADGQSFGSDGVSAVGVYTVTATFAFINAADADNYKLVKEGAEISSLTATLTVGKKSVDTSTLIFEDVNTVYDGNVHRLQVSGTAAGIDGISYEYRNASSGALVGTDGVKDAGTYKVTAIFTVDGNYLEVASMEKTLVIGMAALTVKADDKTITFGDNPAAADLTATFKGLVGNDTESDLGTLNLRVDSSKYTIYGDAGAYAEAITVSGLSSSNYNITYESGTLTVRQRVITVNWYNDSTKSQYDLSYVYADGTVFTPYAEVSNALPGYPVTVQVLGGQSEVGINYVARVDGDSISNKNYVLPVNGIETTFDINPQPPKSGIIIWDNSTLYYNGTAQVPKAYFYEDENDNSPKQLTVTADRTSVNVGTYTATVSYDGNYQLTGDKTRAFTIEKRKVYVEISDLKASLGSVDVSATGWSYVSGSLHFVDGEVYSLTFSCGTVTAEGTYPIFCTFNCNNAANYEVIFTGSYTKLGDENDGKCGTLTVTAASYDMSAVKYTGLEVTYDGQPHEIIISGLPAGVTATVSYAQKGLSLGSAGVTDAGEYTVTVSFSGADGYKNIPDVTKTLTIKKAALTVKANDKNIVYGDMPANGGVTYLLGGVEADGASLGLEGALTLTVNYAQYGDAGKYRIDPAGLTAKNYDITFAPGTLTVSPREISAVWYSDGTASVSGTSFIYDYDGNVHTPYAVASGMINGDTVTLTVSVDGGFKTQAGLNYTARITAVSSGNYCVKEDDLSVSFSIIQKFVIIWDNSPLVYDGEAKLPRAWYYDDDGEHSLTVEVRNDAGAVISAVNAGNYTAYVTDAPANVTGDVSYGFKISPKAVTVTIGSGSLTYGNVESGLQSLLASLLAQIGDLPVSLVCNVNNSTNAGEYAITGIADGDGSDNYVITFVNGKLTIEKANVNISAIVYDGQTKTVEYDGKAQSFEIENLPEGVTRIVYAYVKDGKAVDASAVIAAGTYTVTATFEVDGNHNAVGTTLTATLVIKAAALTANISFTGGEATYDGNLHSVYVTGDMTGVKSVTYEYRNSSGALVGTDGAKNAGTYTVTARVEVEDNYTAVTLSPVTLKINRASITVTANNHSVVYGQTPAQADFGCTVTGLASGDSISELLSLTYSYGTITKAGEYILTVSGAASTDNYTVIYKNGKLTVSPCIITSDNIIWYDMRGGNTAGADGKFSYIYSAGTLNQPYAETVELVNGEKVTLTVSGGQINSGYGYIAEITGISGDYAGNYMLPATGLSVEFDVLPRPLNGNIVWSAEPLYYNGEAQSPKAYYYDEDGNEHEFTVTVEGEAVHVGYYTASVSVSDINYTLTGDTVRTFEILARPVFIAIGDMTVTYGDTPNVSAVSRSYMENSLTILAKDNYALTFTCGSVSGIGEYAIEGHFTCDNPADYNVTFTGSWASAGADNGKYGTLKVVKGVYDAGKISFAGTEVTYDGTYHTLVINGLPDGVTAECVYVNGGFGYGNGGVKNAGVYQVTVTFTGDPNYEPIPAKTATLTVKQAALTVKAKDSEITYGDAPAANGVTYSGFANGENENTLNAIMGGLTYTYGYTQGEGAGEYTITPAGLTSGNYAITFKAGTLTVKPRTITVTWYDDETRSSQNFSYENDGQYHAPYAVAGGLVNGDAVILTVEGEQRAQGYNYVAYAVLDNPNYALPTDGTATQKFTVTAKAGSIVWDNSPIYYNGSVQTPKAYYFDDDGAIHEISGVTIQSGNGVNAGDYTAVVYFDGENRYCPYTILPLEVSIIIKSPAEATVYGNAPEIDQNGWDYAEGSNRFVNGENPVRLYTSVVAGYPAGNYAISGSGSSANYKINFTEGTLTVCKATVDVSGIIYSLTAGYDGGIHRAELTGVPSEIASVTITYIKDNVNYGTDGVREAGVYNLVISFTLKDGANYEAVEDVTGKTFEITKLQADLSGVTFDDVLGAVYDGTAKQILVSGSASGVTGVTYVYTAANSDTSLTDGKAVDAGTYYVDVTFTFDPNYDVSGISLTRRATLIINQAVITVAAGAGSVVYGSDTVNAQSFGYSVTGLAYADTESAVLGTVTLSCTAYSATLGAGEYADYITVGGNASHKNYIINYVPAKLTVTPREITVASWQKGENDPGALLEYEYAAGVSYIPYAIAGNTVNGDNLYLEVITAKNPVGDGYVATVVGIYRDDKVTVATDYALPAHALTVNFNVKYENPVSYEIIWNYSAAYYDGNALKPSATYYDPVTDNFETVNPDWIETFDMNGNPADAVNAGDYTAKVNADKAASASLTFTNADDGMTFTVAPRKVYVTVGDASGKYGENHAVSAAGWSYSAGTAEDNKFIAGDSYTLTITTDAAASSPVGKYAIRAVFGGNGNYEVIFTGGSWTAANADNGKFGTFTVEKATVDTSKVIISGLTATYDGTAHTATVDLSSLPAGVTAEVTYTRGGWNLTGAVDAGDYLVTVTFVTGANYEPAAAKTATLTVAKAKLTVTANPNTIVYGDEPSANGVTYGGFAAGDSESKAGVLTGTVTYEYSCVKGANAGVYKITPKGITADNYDITFVSGALTVEKRVITINWFNDERMSLQTLKYNCDGNVYLPYAEAGNVVAGDSVILTVTGEQSAAGVNYVARVTAVSNPNYALPAEGATASFDIIPEAYVIVWEAKPFVYDGTTQRPEAYYYTANGERVALNVTVKPNYGASDSSGSSVYAGDYMAIASLAGGNVTVTGEFEHPFTIEKRKVTVIIKNSVSAYGEDIELAGWEIAEGSEGFVSGSPVYLTTEATKSSHVGTYEITGVYAGSDNSYEVTFINGVYTIEKASAAVPEILGKEFTGSLLKADVSDTSVYRVYQNDGGIKAGSYKVILELLDYDNYKWVVNGEDVRSANYTLIFEITKAENALTAEFVAREIKAGEAINITAPAALFGTAQVRYYKDEACTQEVVISGNIWNEVEGTYYAKVTVKETDNYGGIEKIYAFTVTGKLSLALYWGDLDHEYNGNVFTPKAYVTLDGRQIELTVTGGQTDAGVYTAVATLKAVDGTDLSKYAFSTGAGAADTTVTYTINARRITVHIVDAESVYGSDVTDINLFNADRFTIDGTLVGTDNRYSLKLSFACDFGSGEFVPAGVYAIVGSCANKNYSVTFEGSMGEYGTYTVREASINVLKNETTWFDVQGVITDNHDDFVTLDRTNEDGSYKYISLKGGQTARITYSSFIAKYNPDVHNGMTEEQIKTLLLSDGGRATPPDIGQGGSWVIYYSIEADNHTAKYGIWKVLIEDPDNYIIITFKNSLPVQYGDVTEGKNLLPDLIANDCIELSGNILPNLTALLAYTEAYAYEDVSSADGVVNGSTSVGSYTIRFVFNEDGQKLYGNANFKYSTTNEPDSDTNLGKFEVSKRVINVELGEVKFVYDGEVHIPSITLKNFVGGEDVLLTDFEIGVRKMLVLSNGDIVGVTVRYGGGYEDMISGSYTLTVEIDNPNYQIGENASIFVTIEHDGGSLANPDGIALPVWAIILIAAGGAALLLGIIIAVIVAKRRKDRILVSEEDDDGFYDEYTE